MVTLIKVVAGALFFVVTSRFQGVCKEAILLGDSVPRAKKDQRKA
jgi:hypothetical protein